MTNANTKLSRQYGLATAIALLVGQVIAVGIFLAPAGMAKSVSSPFWLLAVWLLMSAMALSGALCYGELASRYPAAGGSYVYLREAYGRPMAFLYGWMVLLVLDPGLTSIFAVGLTSYINHLVPLSEIAKPLVAIVSVIIVAAINIVGAGISSSILKGLTILKVGLLLLIIVYGFLGGRGDLANFEPFFAAPPNMFEALAGGLVGAFFAFAGWWELSRLAGEIRDPERNLPRALAYGVIILTVLYIATSAAFMYLVPKAGITSDETFAAQAGEALFGSAGGKIFSTVVIVSVLGTLVAYLMASPRVYYAMARDGLFFESVARLHPRFKTPHRAILIQVLLATILILAGNFQQIISYFFFIAVVFIAMSVTGLFVIRSRHEFAGYKTPLYPVTPIAFLLITAIVLFFIGMRDPTRTLIGTGVVLLGVPVYYFVFGKKGELADDVDNDNLV